jgi:hypothetical protein
MSLKHRRVPSLLLLLLLLLQTRSSFKGSPQRKAR